MVLLIDDQEIIGERLRSLLQHETHIAFHHEQDASCAMEAASGVMPTVILLDLVMPGIDGLVVLRQLKRNEATREIPVVVLSTKEEPTTKAEAFRLGANDYLIKLPSAVELVARIRYHSEAHRNAEMRRVAMNALAESREQLRLSHEEIARQAAGLEIRNRFITRTFGRYLSDEVVGQLLDSPEGLRLGGESRVVTILMADLRGFTSTCEALPATDVMRLLNNYLGAMARVIADHRGTIDEFIGDAILAIFGAPVSKDDDARRAVRCTLAMQREMIEINTANAIAGLPQLEMGVAVHTGEVVVGNIGSDIRAKYGVVGSNVNLTSRIESLSVGGQILISEATRNAVGVTTRVGQQLRFRPKGIDHDVVAWELLGLEREDTPAAMSSNERLVSLEPALSLRFCTVEDKMDAGPMLDGLLVGASERRGLLRCSEPIQPFSEVRIELSTPATETGGRHDVWAKVGATGADGTELFFSRPLSAAIAISPTPTIDRAFPK